MAEARQAESEVCEVAGLQRNFHWQFFSYQEMATAIREIERAHRPTSVEKPIRVLERNMSQDIGADSNLDS